MIIPRFFLQYFLLFCIVSGPMSLIMYDRFSLDDDYLIFVIMACVNSAFCLWIYIISIMDLKKNTGIINNDYSYIDCTENLDAADMVKFTHDIARKFSLERLPRVIISDDPSSILSATGGNDKLVITFNSKFLTLHHYKDLAGGIAHEMAHLKRNDYARKTFMNNVSIIYIKLFTPVAFIMGILYSYQEYAGFDLNNWPARILFGTGVLIVTFFLILLVTKLETILFNFFSRQIEYKADRLAATTVGKSEVSALLSLLKKIEDKEVTDASLSTWERFQRHEVFSTHPSLENRLQALESV